MHLRHFNLFKITIKNKVAVICNEYIVIRLRNFTLLHPVATIFFCTCFHPPGITSTGSGNRPNCATHLLSSAMMISFSDAEATIFSRSNAPPPPFIN